MSVSVLTDVLQRYAQNPILTAADVPFPATMIFNAGVTKYNGRYVMLFRNDWGDYQQYPNGKPHGTNLGLAQSRDGVHWEVSPQPVWQWKDQEVHRIYDPRLTVVDGRCYVCFAMETRHGIRGGLAVTEDFSRFQVLNLSAPDNRNMVLFPERINGHFARLERPFPIYGRGRPEAFDIWYAQSPDCRFWGDYELVLGSEQVPWCNNKIGPGAPPVRTPKGWLTFFHAVDVQPGRTFNGWEKTPWTKRYVMGLMLLDLHEPWRVRALHREPILVPETDYENNGFRGGVIFPGGVVAEPDGLLRIYYGAADTVMAMATAQVDQLLELLGV